MVVILNSVAMVKYLSSYFHFSILALIAVNCLGCSQPKTKQKSVTSGPQILVVIQRDNHVGIYPISQYVKENQTRILQTENGFKNEYNDKSISVAVNGDKATVKTDFDCIVYVERLRNVIRVKKENSFAIK